MFTLPLFLLHACLDVFFTQPLFLLMHASMFLHCPCFCLCVPQCVYTALVSAYGCFDVFTLPLSPLMPVLMCLHDLCFSLCLFSVCLPSPCFCLCVFRCVYSALVFVYACFDVFTQPSFLLMHVAMCLHCSCSAYAYLSVFTVPLFLLIPVSMCLHCPSIQFSSALLSYVPIYLSILICGFIFPSLEFHSLIREIKNFGCYQVFF